MKKGIISICLSIVLAASSLPAIAKINSVSIGRYKSPGIGKEWTSSDNDIIEITSDGFRAVGIGYAVLTSPSGDTREYITTVPKTANKYSGIVNSQKKLHRDIIASANNFDKRMYFSALLDVDAKQDASEDDKAIIAAIEDYLPEPSEFRRPYAYSIDADYAYARVSDSSAQIEVSLKFIYNTDAAVAKSFTQKNTKLTKKEQRLRDKVNLIVKMLGLKKMKYNYEKAIAVHDYLLANSKFDLAALSEDDWLNASDSYSAYGVLINGRGTCKGYSLAYKLILESVGVEVDYIVGYKGELHSWNRVKMDDDKWYHVDVSADDPLPDIKGRKTYTYFALTDKQIAKSHEFEDNEIVANSTKYSYKNILKLQKTK